MHLRKSLIAAATGFAAGLLAWTAAPALAAGPITEVQVNGSSSPGTDAVDGIFRSGTATFAGFTQTCSSGSAAGAVARGPVTAGAPEFTFSSLTISCTWFVPGTVSVSIMCPVTVYMTDATVNTGLTSSTADSAGNANGNVTGTANLSTCPGGTPSIQVSAGPCSYKVNGSIGVEFDELPYLSGGTKYQDLILKGTGLTTSGASLTCFGQIPNGTGITLNDITFGIKVTGGSAPGIDFAIGPASAPDGPITGVEVDGDRTTGAVAVEGTFRSGTAAFAGFTASCSGGDVDGTLRRGPRPGSPDFSFSTFDLSCTSFLPGSPVMTATCPITVSMTDPEVRTGLNDPHTDTIGNGNGNVTGLADLSTCAGGTPSVSVSVGPCSYRVGGSIAVEFDEATHVVGGVAYQDLIFKGGGLTTSNASTGCFGAIPNGTGITLNDITFGIQVAGGSADGIDFYGS